MRRKSILLSAAAIMVVLTLCGSTLVADINEGLISHWRFDEGSGAIAYDSASNNDGTIYGAAWTAGYLGGALDFDGLNDYVNVVDSDDSLDIEDNITIAVWVKLDYFNLHDHDFFVGKQPTGTSRTNYPGNYIFRTTPFNGYIHFHHQTGTRDNQISKYSSTSGIGLGAWHHVSVTLVEGGNVNFYIDGSPAGTVPQLGIFGLLNDEPVRIGTRKDAWSYFHGLLDEVRIYDRALSAVEIEQIYQGFSPDVISLEISGPNEVAENFTAGYKAIAYYDDDSTRDVTGAVLWAVEPNMYASIEEGVLTTRDIVDDQSTTILAGYTEGDVTVSAEKTIDILDICTTGTALTFDGVDDYVDCGSDQSLDVTELTWSLWIKRAETTYTNERALISNEGGGANTSGTYALQIDVGSQQQDKIQFVRHGDSTWPLSNTAIQDTDWHYIAVTRDSSGGAVIYIDGLQDAAGTIGTRTAFTETVIGAGHTSYSNFNGLIDEVAIYNRALGAEEIQANMHTRLVGDEPGLVGYWDFDEGHGQIVYDLSGNGNNGQLGSTPDVDVSDPAWIESDAPIGRCTPYLIATGSIKEAMKHKKASLEKLQAALAEEWTAYQALDQLLESGDYGDLKKGDIVTAMQRIHSAIQHQEQAINTLEKSIEQLEDALIELGYEPMLSPTL